MNIEELAFKDRKILANLNAVDLLNIIEFLQDDSRQCLEEHNKLKEEITNLSKDVDMWNAKYNDMFDENKMLKKQVEERPKEYVFIGNAQNKTRDFINQIIKDNKEFKNQQKEFINCLEDEYTKIQSEIEKETNNNAKYFKIERRQTITGILQKYKEITGVSDENNIS